MAITYFGSASTPVDNGTNVTNPTVVTPPASMVTGDLVVMFACARPQALALAISQAGGQTWNSVSLTGTTSLSSALFWCRYNGTWSANPSVSFPSGTCNVLVMHVFRPTTGTNTWSVEGTPLDQAFAAPTTPFTVTIPTVTTVAASTITLGIWFSGDDNTWGSLSGTGWVVSGTAQYRNTSSTDLSCSFAHRIQTTAGATNAVSKNQLTLGGDAGDIYRFTFVETSAGGTTHEVSVSESIGVAESLGRYFDTSSTVSEPIGVGDSGNRGIDFSLTVNEVFGLIDGIQKSADFTATAAEALGIIDTVTKITTLDKSIVETLTFGDVLSRGVDIAVSLSEGFGVNDGTAKVGDLEKMTQELFIVLDSVLSAGIWNKTVAEVLILADVYQRGIDLLGQANEVITLSDTQQGIISQDVVRDEILTFIGGLTASGLWDKTANELILFNDTVQSQAGLNTGVFESLTFSDLIDSQVLRILSAEVSESIIITGGFLATLVGEGEKKIIKLTAKTTTLITGGKGNSFMTSGKGESTVTGGNGVGQARIFGGGSEPLIQG